jgi:CheY-like chemotaxis protein
MTKLHIWMLGDWDQPEFAPAVDYLRQNAELLLVDGRPPEPDVIFLVASRPGRFSAVEVEQLHRRAPLARLIALLGGWCEGEVRSGHPWPGVNRIYAHQWQARLPRELQTWQPRTATELDRLLTSRPAATTQRQLVGIATAPRTMFEALASACRSFGKDAVWLLPSLPLPVQHVDAMIHDATLDLACELEAMSELRDRLHNPPTLLLLDYPRENDLQLATQAGASAVLARPYLVADLAAEIERITSKPAAVRLIAAA